MTHVPYIVAAYGVSAVVLIGMVAWVLLDLRQQKQKLEHLQRDGRGPRPGTNL